MSSIVTRGMGVSREAIITQGYGRRIAAIVEEAVARVAGKKPGKTRIRKTYDEEEKCIEYVIEASLNIVNGSELEEPIKKEIRRCVEESGIKVTAKKIDVITSGRNEIKIEASFLKKKN